MEAINLAIGSTSKRSRFTPKPVVIDWDALPDASQLFVIRYGLKQFLADAQAGAETEAEAHSSVDERLAKLQSGDLSRTRGEGAAKPDTVETLTIKLAKEFIRAKLKEANATATKEQVAEAAVELAKSDDSFAKEAKKQIDAKAKLAADQGDAAKTVIGNLLASLKKPDNEADDEA